MKRIVAFFTAFVIFLISILGIHFYISDKLELHNTDFGTWTNETKYASKDAITANIDENTLVTFGSSELEHGKGTPYYPAEIFKGQKFNMMMIGAGYYQSLSHATTLASIEPEMKSRKAVLILAPQWFRKKGVLPDAFASRFSETNYIAMLKNDKLSDKTKEYITSRAETLLKSDQPTLKRVKRYEKMFLKKDASFMDKLYFKTYSIFLNEKMRQSVVTNMKLDGLKYGQSQELKDQPIDFDSLRKRAAEDGALETDNNPFYIKDNYYNKNIKKHLKERKNTGVKTGYSESPEYDDLRCFLDVCKELGVEPLLVSVPVNGWWYDYTGFPEEKRREYYDQVKEIADEYGVQMADFTDREYEEYFLEDTIHLGWKGWVDVSESIYQFAKQDSGK